MVKNLPLIVSIFFTIGIEKTNLSRPAVSHYLQILKDAGILKMRREGTKNYYYFDADTEAMNQLIQMLEHAKQFMELLPDRSGME